MSILKLEIEPFSVPGNLPGNEKYLPEANNFHFWIFSEFSNG